LPTPNAHDGLAREVADRRLLVAELASLQVDDRNRGAVTQKVTQRRRTRTEFEIFEAPKIESPPTPEQAAVADLSRAADGIDYSALLDDYPEPEVREAITEMVRAILPGSKVTSLFSGAGTEAMSLIHVWFGPNFDLMRHSHPSDGDCLYYILAGQLTMGNRVLGAGDGFMVPNGSPYAYRAGPEGVEVLEFRAGGGIEGAPAFKLHERSVESLRRLTASAKAHQYEWRAPARPSEQALRQ
jgi:hypothetical protein